MPCPTPSLLTLLLLSSLVTYGGAQLQPGTAGQGTAPGAHHHPQAGLLEDLAVVVVGVTHGPAAEVPLRILLLTGVDEAHVAIRPLLEGIEVLGLLQQGEHKDGVSQHKVVMPLQNVQ